MPTTSMSSSATRSPRSGRPALKALGFFYNWILQTVGEEEERRERGSLGGAAERSGQETVKLAIRALLEVVESGGKHIEVAVMTKDHGLKQLEEAKIDAIVVDIESEKASAVATKNGPPRET
ncbi:proteasome subunit alpha type-7-like [Malus sylvestris]|uniref:proteasome subunit alpha type-7-like n=1 Tax=Malus sylvestris TaxID=3752 RepID=UPI0021ABB44B|nr:proteasome subunit alpha type-7-like [Malus sylvestris]